MGSLKLLHAKILFRGNPPNKSGIPGKTCSKWMQNIKMLSVAYYIFLNIPVNCHFDHYYLDSSTPLLTW